MKALGQALAQEGARKVPEIKTQADATKGEAIETAGRNVA